MKESLRILMLEDSIDDAEILQEFLKNEIPNCEIKLVMNEEDYVAALYNFHPDLVLSDNTLPQFNATEALKIFKQFSLPIPFILVTGTVSEEYAVGIIQLGADDYILKDRLIRLPAAIDAGIKKKKAEAAIKHSEKVREQIMDTSLDAIICIDTNGIITMWNKRAETLFGWKEVEAIGNQVADLIIPANYKKAHKEGFAHYLKTGEGRELNKVIELSSLNHHGDEFPIELAIVPIHENGDSFFCAFIRDISERKMAEETLKLMEKRIHDQNILEQKKISKAVIKAQEEERNYLGMELHDNITQILAGTKIHLGVAAKKSEAMKELLRYPLELIDNAIEELRLLSSRQATPLKNINLEDLVLKLMSLFDKTNIANIQFEYSVANDIIDDELKLTIYRIMQEQVNNIIKHSYAKNVTISIKSVNEDIQILVSDDGVGYNKSNKRKGIGISNMMNRIEFYNGKLQMESSPGGGCKINIQLPYS